MPDLSKTVDTYANYIKRLEADNKWLKEQVKLLREENADLKEKLGEEETPEQPEPVSPPQIEDEDEL